MKNIQTKGLFIEENFLLNYSRYNINSSEAFFLLQLNYISNQGKIKFDLKRFASELSMSEEELIANINSLYKKNILFISEKNKIQFLLDKSANYYTLKELYIVVEKITNKILNSKEMNILSTWIDKCYTKEEILSAFKSSKNINYVDAILNNKPININNKEDEDDILFYEWLHD